MSNADWIDVAAGIIILLVLSAILYLRERERARIGRMMDNSVGEKYMQLMAAFMKQDGARLVDMSPNSADMKIKKEGFEESFSISQNDTGVSVEWSLSEGANKLSRSFQFVNDETQEDIMTIIAAGISKAKKTF